MRPCRGISPLLSLGLAKEASNRGPGRQDIDRCNLCIMMTLSTRPLPGQRVFKRELGGLGRYGVTKINWPYKELARVCVARTFFNFGF